MGNCFITRRGLPSETSVKQEGIYPIGADGRPMGNVIVPDTVTRLYQYIFWKDTNVWSIALPNSLLSIDMRCFMECSSLTSINIPNTLEEIPDYCFNGCTELRTVDISAESSCTSIGEQAFYGCSSLKNFIFPYGLRWIGIQAFYDCKSLTEIHLPSTIDCITKEAFYNCQAVREIILSPKIISIGDGGFRYNYYTQKICTHDTIDSEYALMLPSRLTSLGDNAFEGCFSHVGMGAKIFLHQALENIGNACFRQCSNLSHVDIEDGTNLKIGNNAFENCTMLDDESVYNITSHSNTIGTYAFSGCNKLQNVNTKMLSSYMFSGCASLESITGTNICNDSGSYIIQTCSNLKSVILKSAGGKISARAFANCASVETIKILDTSTSIDVAVFYGDTNLKNLYLTGTITSCVSNSLTATNSNYILYNCTALENVILGSGWSMSIRLNISNNLTHDSLIETINNLADLNALGIGSQTLTIGSTNKAKLSADEIAIATSKGWSVT